MARRASARRAALAHRDPDRIKVQHFYLLYTSSYWLYTADIASCCLVKQPGKFSPKLALFLICYRSLWRRSRSRRLEDSRHQIDYRTTNRNRLQTIPNHREPVYCNDWVDRPQFIPLNIKKSAVSIIHFHSDIRCSCLICFIYFIFFFFFDFVPNLVWPIYSDRFASWLTFFCWEKPNSNRWRPLPMSATATTTKRELLQL